MRSETPSQAKYKQFLESPRGRHHPLIRSRRATTSTALSDLRLVRTLLWCLLWATAAAAQVHHLIPINPTCDPSVLTHRLTLVDTLGLRPSGRDTYARMIVKPSFDGETAVSLYGPGPVGGMDIVVLEASSSVWAAVQKRIGDRPPEAPSSLQVDIPVRRWQAPVEASLGLKILAAFQRAFKEARFETDRGVALDPDTFEFAVHLFGGGLASAELTAPRGSVPDHPLYRLAAAMIAYAKAPVAERDRRARAAELQTLTEEIR